MRVVARSNQPVTRPIVRSYRLIGRGVSFNSLALGSRAGSCQMLDSIGSSVKLTNIEISTADTMVMPNS